MTMPDPTARPVRAERIAWAAIKRGKAVIGLPHPARHGDIFRRFGLCDAGVKETQGFVTSTGRFVDREEAWRIAYSAQQIIRDSGQRELYTEDMW